jgi:hypothetical protein
LGKPFQTVPQDEFMSPSFGGANMGALAGSVAGAIGGLFALGIAPAIISHNPALLFETPILGLASFFISGGLGWLIGGQVGPRIGNKLRFGLAEVIGGAAGGLVPVIALALLGWYLVTPH